MMDNTQISGMPKMIDNVNLRVRDDLEETITKKSKLRIAAACFSIYAYEELKKSLSGIEDLQFIFTSPTFTTEKAEKSKREFYIPRMTREQNLYGTEFEIRLRNELTQRAIAKECAEWIKQKATFKSNTTNQVMQGFLNVVSDKEQYTYMPFNEFTTVDLGCERGNYAYNFTQRLSYPMSKSYIDLFEQLWNDKQHFQDVTDQVIENITTVYNENSPEFIYFVTLYNIFSEFLDDVSEDTLPNEATGFKDSKVWNMLFNFQRDAVLAIINKLEKYNGCILADSVGLGKTFTALAVIKYYESRNKSVLVLCPKKLSNNWNTYRDNYINNPLAEDRLNYKVLYHTDLGRTHGFSNGTDLSRLRWDTYDLVVIDESHNFRNGGKLESDDDGKDNRYVTLMKQVIRKGVKTKVLMLSATPVNTRFNDLKNQLQLAYEGDSTLLDSKLKTSRSIDEIFRNAQKVFNTWNKWEPCDRTTDNLLRMLDFDFFEVLDSVTIARSRKHIEKYYDTTSIGKFPERLPPKSHRPHLTDLKDAISYNEIFEQLTKLNLDIYRPSHYILPSRKKVLYDRPTAATSEYFKGKFVKVDGKPTAIDDKTAKYIERYLSMSGYIDLDGKVTDKYRMDLEMGTLASMPESLAPMAEGVHTLVQSVFDESALERMVEDGKQTKIENNELNDNFYKKEFQELWKRINHKYAYAVSFNSSELIEKAIKHIDNELFVSELTYTVSKGEQTDEMDANALDRGEAFKSAKTRTTTLKRSEVSQIKYDLVGKIAEGTVLTRKTVVEIIKGISPLKFAMYKANPEEFIAKVTHLINEQKATMIVEHISYDQIEGEYDSTIFTAEKTSTSIDKAFKATKHIQDYVFTDGYAEKSVERRFAEDLDAADEVCVYAKLPRGFHIPTPVGNYSPDWAIAFNEGAVKHIFFIAETKGTMESLSLKPIEKAKISCARKLFNEISTENVKYHDVDSYQHLLDIMKSIK